MGRGDFAQRRAQAAIGRVGTPVVLRHLAVDGGPNPAPNPPNIDGGLVIDGAHAAGAATLALRAKLLIGRLVAGDTITVGAAVYTVTGDVTAADNRLAAIPIASVLTTDVADGAAASVAFAADETVYAVINSYPAVMIDGTLIQQSDLRVTLPALPLKAPPALTDKLLVAGVPRSILSVVPFYAAGQISHYQLQAR